MRKIILALLFYTGCVWVISCKKEKDTTPPKENKPPVAHAGADQTITLPNNSVTLDGSGSSDPDNNITTYLWTKISGSSLFTITKANAVQTAVSGLEQGTYQFELKVTDAGGLSSKDTVQVIVLPAPLMNDSLHIISGAATLIRIGSLSEAKYVVPATAGDKVVFAGGFVNRGYMGSLSFPTASVDIYQLSTNTWSTATLSETRYVGAIATAGNKILFAGGYSNAGQASSRVDIYDAITNTWTMAELSITRSDMITAVAGNKAFFAGGWTNSGYSDRVDIYDAVTNTWSTATLSQTRMGISAIAAGNKVFFAGGYRNYNGLYEFAYDFSTRVDIYDIATNQWSTAELSEAKYGMAAATIGNKVFFAGGTTSEEFFVLSDRVDVYDVAANTWSTTLLSEARTGIKAATAGNKVVFAGGYNKQGATATVDLYDVSNSWSTALLSQPGIISSTATLGNKILFFTGGDHNANRMDIYDASAGTWSTVAFNKWIHSFPIAAGNEVFIGGGRIGALGTYNGSHLISNVWKLRF